MQTLLVHYLGIDIDIQAKPGVIHYELTWSDKKLTIMDQFFGHTIVGHTYLAEDRIPKTVIMSSRPALQGAAILFGKDHVDVNADSITSHADLFAGAFFMLTRWEESIGFHEDLHGRFPAEKAVAVNNGLILRSLVDEYVAVIKSWLQQLGYHVPASKHVYKNAPTADVDIPSYWLRPSKWRVIAGEWWKKKSFTTIREANAMIGKIEAGELPDPYDTFDYMMDKAEDAGLRFEFNMLVGGISKFDGFYSLKQPHIVALIKKFEARGHAIGLHPSYNSFFDKKLIHEEKQLLENVLGKAVTTSRQHYLKFSVPKTWQLLSEEGIRVDSSMGYAAAPGFRCGTCKPFPVFDVHQRLQLPLIERPLLVMDVSLRYYRQFTPEESIALIDAIDAQVKMHDGEFVWLWHNSNLSDFDDWLPWRKVFEHLMKL